MRAGRDFLPSIDVAARFSEPRGDAAYASNHLKASFGGTTRSFGDSDMILRVLRNPSREPIQKTRIINQFLIIIVLCVAGPIILYVQMCTSPGPVGQSRGILRRGRTKLIVFDAVAGFSQRTERENSSCRVFAVTAPRRASGQVGICAPAGSLRVGTRE
jgi:hypothetical protein